jgi:hypothetical protein
VPALQDPPKKPGWKIRKKGGLNMKKIVPLIFSWVFFISGILITEPGFKVLLLSVARVLPSALLNQNSSYLTLGFA